MILIIGPTVYVLQLIQSERVRHIMGLLPSI